MHYSPTFAAPIFIPTIIYLLTATLLQCRCNIIATIMQYRLRIYILCIYAEPIIITISVFFLSTLQSFPQFLEICYSMIFNYS